MKQVKRIEGNEVYTTVKIKEKRIEKEVINFDFIIGDMVQEVDGSRRGFITAVQNPTVTIKWCDTDQEETITVDRVK